MRADEQLCGFVRGAETLPRGSVRSFTNSSSLHDGKAERHVLRLRFRVGDSNMALPIASRPASRSNSIISTTRESMVTAMHWTTRTPIASAGEASRGSIGCSAPSRIRSVSPLRLESGYLWNDEVDGLPQKRVLPQTGDRFPEGFPRRHDHSRVRTSAAEWAWGKQPAEEYPREFSYEVACGRLPFRSELVHRSGERTCARSIRSSISTSSSIA